MITLVLLGAMTGLPLKYEDDIIKEPWLKQHKPLDKVYYFSEILIYSDYRGKGLGRELFEAAEATARDFSVYDCFSLATVIREDNHPQNQLITKLSIIFGSITVITKMRRSSSKSLGKR